MKAFLIAGLIICGMVATEGVIVDEYDCGEDVFVDSYEATESELLLDVEGDEVLVCLEDDELHRESDIGVTLD